MTNLEQSFADLCAKHDLLNADISMITTEGCHPFHASMQWRDETKQHGRGIASAHGDTIAEALSAAVQEMLIKRAASAAFADEALPDTADV